jgi:hypothetical protein
LKLKPNPVEKLTCLGIVISNRWRPEPVRPTGCPKNELLLSDPSTLGGKTPSVQWSRQNPQYKVSFDPKRVQNKMFCSFAYVAQIALWPYVG